MRGPPWTSAPAPAAGAATRSARRPSRVQRRTAAGQARSVLDGGAHGATLGQAGYPAVGPVIARWASATSDRPQDTLVTRTNRRRVEFCPPRRGQTWGTRGCRRSAWRRSWTRTAAASPYFSPSARALARSLPRQGLCAPCQYALYWARHAKRACPQFCVRGITDAKERIMPRTQNCGQAQVWSPRQARTEGLTAPPRPPRRPARHTAPAGSSPCPPPRKTRPRLGARRRSHAPRAVHRSDSYRAPETAPSHDMLPRSVQ